jgi:hypothetical protein
MNGIRRIKDTELQYSITNRINNALHSSRTTLYNYYPSENVCFDLKFISKIT